MQYQRVRCPLLARPKVTWVVANLLLGSVTPSSASNYPMCSLSARKSIRSLTRQIALVKLRPVPAPRLPNSCPTAYSFIVEHPGALQTGIPVPRKRENCNTRKKEAVSWPVVTPRLSRTPSVFPHMVQPCNNHRKFKTLPNWRNTWGGT